MDRLGVMCNYQVPAGTAMRFCTDPCMASEADEKQLEEWWKEYFVFGVVRNPFTRFTSGYSYLNTLMSDCPKPSFKQACYDPFIQVKICGIADCCFLGSVPHNVHYMADQSSCFFTEGGELSVDFIAETENLEDDSRIILEELNRRRQKGVPALPLDSTNMLTDYHAGTETGYDYEGVLFQQNPECLGSVAHIYEQDLQWLQFDTGQAEGT